MPTSPSPITALDGITPPSRNDPTNFRARGDATLGAFPALITQLLAAAVATYNNAVEALASAEAATASANAPLWVSGTTYVLGAVAWSPTTRFVYRRIVAGAGVTDPSADATNWALANPAQLVVVSVAGTTQAAAAGSRYRLKNAAASTVTLPASPADKDTVAVTASNGRTDNVVARNGRLIGGLAEDLTLSVAGETIVLSYDLAATNWELINV